MAFWVHFFIQIAIGGSQFILYVHKIDEYENCRLLYGPELTKKDMILTFQRMLNSHLHHPKTNQLEKLEAARSAYIMLLSLSLVTFPGLPLY